MSCRHGSSRSFQRSRSSSVLRDPVDRAISAYLHKAQYGRVAAVAGFRGHGRHPRWRRSRQPALIRSACVEQVFRAGSPLERNVRRVPDVVGSGDLRTDETQVLKLVTRHLEVEYNLIQPAPRETNVGARSTLELRLRRQMHRAITTVDPLTQQLGPRTRNHFKSRLWSLDEGGRQSRGPPHLG